MSRDPVVLVPGLNCTGALFAAQTARLAPSRQVLVADHTRDDTLAGLAESVLSAAPERFALAGLSMGGYLAFEILRRAPERVTRLMLLDTSARADTEEATERRRRLIALTRKGGFAEIPGLQMPTLLGQRALADPDTVALVRAMAMEIGPDAFIRQQSAILGRPDSRPDLAGIACPVLVVAGAEDQITPPDIAREMADGLPDARLEIVGGAGHLSTIEAPERLADLLEAFLDEGSGATRR
ncbi:alpha/beta fold hydrolase [Methylobrevis pamukkalensis]|uniref:Putative non-heme bromoperoxidase BpoC n=1 Tax=Methylobrevis pamukkalensis TaxID=1439726 RepID=A0A1E3H640_9HYPH|nr:alpha/beta fold hydrolase [Methylobrevis pamukkalensis]ODN71784.1 putative non-heme bromoperoxidase BpoC [Methylobrevis pamukkalensis]